MSNFYWRVCDLARRQHEVVAVWQLKAFGARRHEIDSATRGLRRVYRGVCAFGDLDELGWYMAAALALGPTAAISHLSALVLLGLRPHQPLEIDVSVRGTGGRAGRGGLQIHRRGLFETGTCHGIPVTSPAQSLRDAGLPPHELYRALEEADRQQLPIHPFLDEISDLRRRVRGRTRSDAEARLIVLCHQRGLELPLVNHRLNGFETDFHWPRHLLVLEVDGFEFHRDRHPFEEDRRRGLAHRIAGYEVLRASALQVEHEPDRVAAALLAAAPSLSSSTSSGRRCRASA